MEAIPPPPELCQASQLLLTLNFLILFSYFLTSAGYNC